MKRYHRTAEITPDRGPFRDRTARRLRSGSGFTLAETLLAVLILLLVSVIVSTGMPAAMNAYRKVVLSANAKTMLSTAITALHDEIGTAWKVENSTDRKSLTYFNASTGAKSRIAKYVPATEGDPNPDAIAGSVWIWDYISLKDDLIHEDSAEVGDGYEMISGVGLTPRMYVTYESIDYDDDKGVVTISGLKVCNFDHENEMLAQLAGTDGNPKTLKIRVISADSAGT